MLLLADMVVRTLKHQVRWLQRQHHGPLPDCVLDSLRGLLLSASGQADLAKEFWHRLVEFVQDKFDPEFVSRDSLLEYSRLLATPGDVRKDFEARCAFAQVFGEASHFSSPPVLRLLTRKPEGVEEALQQSLLLRSRAFGNDDDPQLYSTLRALLQLYSAWSNPLPVDTCLERGALVVQRLGRIDAALSLDERIELRLLLATFFDKWTYAKPRNSNFGLFVGNRACCSLRCGGCLAVATA
jgi:hypothetical protein